MERETICEGWSGEYQWVLERVEPDDAAPFYELKSGFGFGDDTGPYMPKAIALDGVSMNQLARSYLSSLKPATAPLTGTNTEILAVFHTQFGNLLSSLASLRYRKSTELDVIMRQCAVVQNAIASLVEQSVTSTPIATPAMEQF
jgi:hypothetical protein